MSKAERMSFDMIDATCPVVDKLMKECISNIKMDLDEYHDIDGDKYIESHIDDMVRSIKEMATEKLREALIDACQRIVDLERGRE